MNNELISKEDQVLSVIEKMASNPDVDVEKLERMLDMQERFLAMQSQKEFNAAMARLQPKMPAIKKTKQANKHKYAPYEEIDKLVRPLYTAEGFSVSFDQKKQDDGTIIYYGTLSHEGGHNMKAEITLPDDTSGSKNAIQAKGSSMSYAKRYLLTMLLNIVTEDEDDDAESFDVIDTEKAAEIDTLVRNTGADREKFLKWLGVDDVRNIKQRDYAKAKTQLQKKGQKNGNS